MGREPAHPTDCPSYRLKAWVAASKPEALGIVDAREAIPKLRLRLPPGEPLSSVAARTKDVIPSGATRSRRICSNRPLGPFGPAQGKLHSLGVTTRLGDANNCHGSRRGPWRFHVLILAKPQFAGNSSLFFVEYSVATRRNRSIYLGKNEEFL